MSENQPLPNPNPRWVKHIGYELFIAGLSGLAILNEILVLIIHDSTIEQVVLIMNLVLSGIFFLDFLSSFLTTHSRRNYMVRGLGWADLLSSFPFPLFKFLRIFGIVRTGRVVSHYGVKRMAINLYEQRAQNVLLFVIFFILLLLEFGSLQVLRVEKDAPGANILTAEDALWWIYVTITTVGFGDRFPVTSAGRILGILVMTTSVLLVGTLTGFISRFFLTSARIRTRTYPEQDPRKIILELRQDLERQQGEFQTLQEKLNHLEILLTQDSDNRPP